MSNRHRARPRRRTLAMELVIRYAYERDTAGRQDALLDLLHELRHRTAPTS